MFNYLRKATSICLLPLVLMMFSTSSQAGFMDELVGNITGFNSPEHKLKMYQAIEDKQLVSGFYSLSQDGKIETIAEDIKNGGFALSGIDAAEIAFKKRAGEIMNMNAAEGWFDRYMSNADDDEIAKKYIAIALGRGNSVAIYRPGLGEILCDHFGILGLVNGPQRAAFCGHDRVLVEQDKTGRVVSLVTRVFQGWTFKGVTLNQYTAIISGGHAMRHIEDSISQREMDRYFIREIRPTASRQPTPQPKEDDLGHQSSTPSERNL